MISNVETKASLSIVIFVGDEFLRHTQTRIYCHKPKCRSLKNQKERNKIKPAEPGKYKMFNLGPGPKACRDHQITRETINESVKEFLEKENQSNIFQVMILE